MVAAIAECDANYLKHSLDLATYRGASYMDTVLHDKLGGTFNTMNLSAPGQMPSDAYLTLKAALKEGMKPNVIVYGLAPRDFLDGTMQSPSDTEAFKYLRRSVDISDCGLDYFSSPFGKLEWLLQRSVNLYGISLDCRLMLEKTFQAVYKPQRVDQSARARRCRRSFRYALESASAPLQHRARHIHGATDRQR